MIRVCFLIRSLGRGGAERQLVALARALDPARFQRTILTFYPGGPLGQDLAGSGVELVSLSKRGRWDVGAFLWRACREIAARKPDVVHGYLGVANEIAWLAGRLCGARVVWGIRASALDLAEYDWTFRASLVAGRLLSPFVDLIIYNSHAGAAAYREYGYRPRRAEVIPNGVDLARFQRDEAGRARVRAEWGVAPDEPLVGIVGRLDPMKAHDVFLAAAARLHEADRRCRFVCIGTAESSYARHLRESPVADRLRNVLVWAGARADMNAVYSALDCFVLCSRFGEGLPNALAEAMACEVSCVTTAVGDAELLAGHTGRVVPVDDAPALAEACLALLSESGEERTRRGREARARVSSHYSLEQLENRTAEALALVAHGREMSRRVRPRL